jgi:hypothetical protein
VSILRRAARPAGPVTYVPDVSEFQPDIHDAVLLKWTKAVIIRAMYGSVHDDKAWFGGQRRAQLHQQGAVFVGIYQYVVADQSAVVQAKALLDLIGPLRPGEMIFGDFEEGAGNQSGRWQAWAKTIHAGTGEQPRLYSGLAYAASHGLAPDWVAAYQRREPAGRHILWQFTDRQQVPGVGTCDCSVFHGSAEELAALARPAPPARHATPPAPPAGPARQALGLLPTLKPGDRDLREPWMVRRVQGLVDALTADCPATGTFDAKTVEVVKDFQASHGLKADGIVGPSTWSMLIYGRAV